MKNKIISFKFFSSAYAILCFSLSLCLLFAPSLIYGLFGMEGNLSADILSHRSSMLLLGFSILAFLSRNEPLSNLRQRLTIAMGATMFSLLIIGLYEFLRGTVGAGIWVAIIGEAVFVYLSFHVWKQS